MDWKKCLRIFFGDKTNWVSKDLNLAASSLTAKSRGKCVLIFYKVFKELSLLLHQTSLKFVLQSVAGCAFQKSQLFIVLSSLKTAVTLYSYGRLFGNG